MRDPTPQIRIPEYGIGVGARAGPAQVNPNFSYEGSLPIPYAPECHFPIARTLLPACEPNGAVAEALLHDMWLNARSKEQRGAGVPKAVHREAAY